MINDAVKDTENMLKDILTRKHDIDATIEMLKAQVELLKELLQFDDLTSLIELKQGTGAYNDNSPVENEVFFNEQIEKAIEFKRREIKQDIKRLETAIRIKESVMNQLNDYLKSDALDTNQKLLIQYCYIDKKINNDNYNDIINRFNQGKTIKRKVVIYSVERIIQIRNSAITIIAEKFIKIRHLLKEV